MGAAASQLDLQRPNAVLHLAVTVASLEEQRGFVLVLEDTSDLLRAQKSAAWQEVARRIAHEIKNPLTPISLSADRIARQASQDSSRCTCPGHHSGMHEHHSARGEHSQIPGRRVLSVFPIPTRPVGVG